MVYQRDLEMQQRWGRLMKELESIVGKRPKDLNSVLFLIGTQELGQGNQVFSKEEKQDLMHIAICKVLSLAGYYELKGVDEEGWPHWELVKKLPRFDLLDQEKLLKIQILEYFTTEIGIAV